MSNDDFTAAWQAIEAGLCDEGVKKLEAVYSGRLGLANAIVAAYVWSHKLPAALEAIEKETMGRDRYRFDTLYRFKAVICTMMNEPSLALTCLEDQWKCQYAQGGVTQRPLLYFHLWSYFPEVVSVALLHDRVSRLQPAGDQGATPNFLRAAYGFLLGDTEDLVLPENPHRAITQLEMESMAWHLLWIKSIRLRVMNQLAEIPQLLQQMSVGFPSQRQNAQCHAARYDFHRYVHELW